MPSPAPFSSPQNNLAFPALYLYPLNDSFIPKHISLNPPGQRVKIGRQTNAKTSPGERNGYFDSKVLSRQHAEVWEENGKIFIKDVRSSNGTFVNSERLSAEGVESEPFELHTDDIVEFGIDIVGEDNKTIIHHKVAARVSCIFNEQQARADQQQNQGQYSQSSMLPQAGPQGASSFNFAPGGPQGQRRPQMPHQGLNGMGGMGASMRAPGKSGLTFDHILSRLQGELTKSRETGQDLQTLSGAMNDIQDTLGGSLPQNLPPFPHVLPPVRPPQAESSAPSPPQLHPPAPETGSPALSELQSQLLTTQSSLASHVDKIRALEGVLAEQEAIKQEVRTLRDLVGVLQQGSAAQEPKGGFDLEDDEGEADDEDSDAHSVSTVMPHALERVDEEDEEEEDEPVHADDKQDEEHEPRSLSPEHQDIFQEHEEDREQRRAELGRPRTPEPTNMGMSRNLARSSTLRSPLAASSSSDASVASPPGPTINELTNRLALLSTQLESALAMSSTLQAQHAAAQSTIVALEDKVKRLEGLVSAVVSSAPSNKETTGSKNDTTESPAAAESAVTAALLSFKNSLQGQWSSVQEEWAQERERLKRTRDDWENQMRGMVDERIKAKFTNSFPAPMSYPHANGGLATPPSPRSLSADSAHGRRRRRRSTSRGRSGSPKGVNGNGDILNGSDSAPGSPMSDDAITELALRGGGVLPTPESSVHASSLSSFDGKALLSSAAASDIAPTSPPAEAEKSLRALNGSGQHKNQNDNTAMHIQTAIGVLVLSVAAAAVIWRVKPE
ncbi:Glycosyltransferase family 69 protein [Mycena venus]|uniref:Glycosyltransferase family 69 protein n=1 Tax=Mycena venus TaxID=2733690 RepID=A0A8H6TZ54_9AGAR|nr:Glycosyltransferase family 69 protein [Mycena venus]